jgi:hypothetical protein
MNPVTLDDARSSVPDKGAGAVGVSGGETVVVRTKQGVAHKGRLVKADESSVELIVVDSGQLVPLPRTDILSVSRSEFSAARTPILVVGLGVVVYSYAYAKAASKLLGGL